MLRDPARRGRALAVPSADPLTELGWGPLVARRIALEQTNTPNATIHDTLAGDKIRLYDQDARDIYRDSCCDRAAALGHPIPNPSNVKNAADTTVMVVGDTLYDNAIP